MSASQLTAAARITLAVGALATLALLVYEGGFDPPVVGFALWALLPYALFLYASAFAGSRGRALVLWLVCALAVLFALVSLGADLFVSADTISMPALTFVVVPLFQAIIAVFLLVPLFCTRPAAASNRVAA